MQVKLTPLDEIFPYYQNAKPHKVKLKILQTSINKFGFDQPIVVDEDGIIIKGHGRRLASLNLGIKEVPVVVKEGLTEVQKKIIRIADNKIFEKSDIEVLKVKEELEALNSQGVEGLADFFKLDDYGIKSMVKDALGTSERSKSGTGSAVEGSMVSCPICGSVHWEDD
ncbi:MAG: hypothetical protein GQ570_03585 [Helicobacteraceae bacterium]|nr:hypothetical protein [Helicobacteraceae bacterium]